MGRPDSSPNLSLPLFPSRQLVMVLLAGHLMPVLLLLTSDIRLPWLVVGGLLILVHMLYARRQLEVVRALRQLDYRNRGYSLVLPNGKRIPTEIQARFLTPWLTILEVRLEGRGRLLPLFPDSSDAASLRRLRVLLRCGHGSG